MTSEAGDSMLERARVAARAHAATADAVAQLVERAGSPPDAADLAEYAALLKREESTLRQRTAALDAAGLSVASVGEDDEGAGRADLP